jgi:hypothetical protein
MEIRLLIGWRTFYFMKEIRQKWSRYSKLSGSPQSSTKHKMYGSRPIQKAVGGHNRTDHRA